MRHVMFIDEGMAGSRRTIEGRITTPAHGATASVFAELKHSQDEPV